MTRAKHDIMRLSGMEFSNLEFESELVVHPHRDVVGLFVGRVGLEEWTGEEVDVTG
jgi:hypothetical protein